MIKKKFIIITLIILLFFSIFYNVVNAEVIDTQNYYDVYENMKHDIDIAKTWAQNNFSNSLELRNYISNTYNTDLSDKVFFAIPAGYTSNPNTTIRISFLATNNYGDPITFNYYGITSPGFNTTGTRSTITFSLSSTDPKQITSFLNTSSVTQFFSGYYFLKLDYLFTDSTITDNEIAANTENMYNSMLNTEEFITNTTDNTDNSIASASSTYNNFYNNEIEELNSDSGSGLFLSRIKQWYNNLINSNLAPTETLEFDLNFFGQTEHFSMSSDYTSNLLLKMCGGDTLYRNIIRNIIQSLYYLVFFLYFGKLYYNMIGNILSANISSFRNGIHLMFL